MPSNNETLNTNFAWVLFLFPLLFGFQNCTNPLRFNEGADTNSSSNSLADGNSLGHSGTTDSDTPVNRNLPVADSKGTSSLSYNTLEMTYEDKSSFTIEQPCRVYALV